MRRKQLTFLRRIYTAMGNVETKNNGYVFVGYNNIVILAYL
jgi:hypothetical protein